MTEGRRYLSPKEKLAVRMRQENICACGCGESLESGVHYDHDTPLHLGGSNDIENFRALKPRHHMAKSAKEARTRAKVARIQEQGGLLKKKKSRADKFADKFFGGNR